MSSSESSRVTIPAGTKTHTVTLTETYASTPVVNITSLQNTNVYVSEVTNSYFKINKNSNEEVTVHFIVIESEQ